MSNAEDGWDKEAQKNILNWLLQKSS